MGSVAEDFEVHQFASRAAGHGDGGDGRVVGLVGGAFRGVGDGGGGVERGVIRLSIRNTDGGELPYHVARGGSREPLDIGVDRASPGGRQLVRHLCGQARAVGKVEHAFLGIGAGDTGRDRRITRREIPHRARRRIVAAGRREPETARLRTDVAGSFAIDRLAGKGLRLSNRRNRLVDSRRILQGEGGGSASLGGWLEGNGLASRIGSGEFEGSVGEAADGDETAGRPTKRCAAGDGWGVDGGRRAKHRRAAAGFVGEGRGEVGAGRGGEERGDPSAEATDPGGDREAGGVGERAAGWGSERGGDERGGSRKHEGA